MGLQPRGIFRLGYVRLALHAGDCEKLRAFYTGMLGVVESPLSTAERLLFRCWHEAHPYSLVVELGQQRKLVEVGFEVASAHGLRALAARIRGRGLSLDACEADEALPGIGASVACTAPGDLRLRLYVAGSAEPAYLGGHISPNWVTPRALRATTAPLFLNHVGITVPEPAETVEFLTSTLDFVVSERIESDDGSRLRSALVFRMSKDVGGQELAIFRGRSGGLHHIAFTKEDASDILVDGQYLADADVKIDAMGPTRQSYGKTFSLHFYDPFGIRLELCSGGRITEAHPEFEPVVWTESNLGKALSFYDAQVSESFLDACL